ncbi:MAG: hypothetical protein ACLGHX_13290 [Acidimicrobiia bacterium]
MTDRMRAVVRWVGLSLFLVVGFFYLASGLLVPTWPWLALLNATGVVIAVVTFRYSVERWWIAFAGPVAAIAFWYLYVNLGDALLGWTA